MTSIQTAPGPQTFTLTRSAYQPSTGIAGESLLPVLDSWDGHRFAAPTTEQKILTATLPNILDNPDAQSLRSDYSHKLDEATREKADSQLFGEGHHQGPNHEQVDVTVDHKTGERTVHTRYPDGSSKTVTVNERKPDFVRVDKEDGHGGKSTLQQDGTQISFHDGVRGETTAYNVDSTGRPSREVFGPHSYVRTTANEDGSTDELHESGQGYWTRHQVGRADDTRDFRPVGGIPDPTRRRLPIIPYLPLY